eukprot:TRINITY_DN924_c0_g2_i1.p1 TRINITY_DN924_c0_g2~~TRINITY_DN924_c0_g2_i1.p1  ORF type:complete len:271 (+),score=60.85 TRINITY_DN924_c0_g2_i1:89-901(+)
MAAATETWRSKLGNKYPKRDVEQWDAQMKAELAALRKLGSNKSCFDCGSSDTTWASPKLGVFICTTCSDIHRAAGAHITCVKNFSTYLWGPDEVEVMQAVGNSKGRDIYGNATVLPSDPKHHKVAACTKKYGCPSVGNAIQALVAAAAADACASPKTEPLVQPPSLASIKRGETWAAGSQGHVNSKTKSAAASGADWFDDFLAQDSFVPAPACVNKSAAPVQSETAEAMDLDDFLNMCSGSGPPHAATKKKQACLGHGLDDLIFEDFGKC